MRKQKKKMLWPVYFDASRTRKEGRKVPKNAAIPNPSLDEIRRAVERLDLMPEVEAVGAHPAMPWRKTGRVWIQKEDMNGKVLLEIAKEIMASRQKTEK
ncbi:MAG: signal recognition particle [Candidatus Bathyarchaeota archaeon]|nr:MAG: signal recognition particle [Candidatus Bathyarchaeota archaeon]